MAFRNIRLHPVLRIIYFLLRVVSAISTRVFYRRRAIIGRENVVFDGPAIVICNHPSTLMDVLNVGIHIRQEMFFLANYGLFKHPVSHWILSRLYCIPVKRQEDVAPGETRDNLAAFEQCFTHLEKNGILFIAPEGVSWMNRWVRPFKTGTARIALGMEARHNWQAGLKIIPVGLSYNHPNWFRSNMSIHFGAAIGLKDWAEAWENDPKAASEQLTALLEEKVAALTINTQNETGEQVLTHWEKMLHVEAPTLPETDYFRSKTLADRCLPDKELVEKTIVYLQQIQTANLDEIGLSSKSLRWWQYLWWTVASPIAVLGILCWYWPCKGILLLTRKLKLYIGYDATVKILLGLMVFPLWLWFMSTFIHYMGFWKSWPVSLVWLVLITLGFGAEWWLDVWKSIWEKRKTQAYKDSYPIDYEEITSNRLGVLNALASYLK